MSDRVTPGPLVADALEYVNDQIGRMITAMKGNDNLNTTTIMAGTTAHTIIVRGKTCQGR